MRHQSPREYEGSWMIATAAACRPRIDRSQNTPCAIGAPHGILRHLHGEEGPRIDTTPEKIVKHCWQYMRLPIRSGSLQHSCRDAFKGQRQRIEGADGVRHRTTDHIPSIIDRSVERRAEAF